MYYWNQDNFDGLKQIYHHFIDDPYFALYAEYCHFRESGLRKIAFKKLEEFIQNCKKLDVSTQRNIVITLMDIIYNHLSIHQLSSEPLNRYVIKVLKDWMATGDQDIQPYQWLGYLCQDIEFYRKALELDPHQQFCLIQLVKSHLKQVDWQTHHLDLSFLIGELTHAYDHLTQAHALIDKIDQSSERHKLEIEYRYFTTLLNAWENYQNSKVDSSFSLWCEDHHIDFNEYITIYYSN